MRISRRTSAAGYTLVEVMIVVAIIAVMAALAVVGYRRWVQYAQLADTKDIVNAIVAQQEFYFRDTNGYLSCSSDFSDDELYPMVPNDKKHPFHNPSHSDYPCWKVLAPDLQEPTYMSFGTVAGLPTEDWPTLPDGMQKTSIDVAPNEERPWYVVAAIGDVDANGTRSFFLAHSMQPGEVHIESDDE